MFQMNECIRKTKSRIPLTKNEIYELVRGITANDSAEQIPDYQLAAWLMAVCFQGLTDKETADLTMAMRDSGQVMHWDFPGPVADKHSTGGVGDKTTLILAPIAAACGIYMPKMSGKGLGHTGGTIDKLESIPGLTTALEPKRFLDVVNKAGFAVAMQSGNLASADKKLYALRDVTETVNSIPLICASIMSKKLATGADHILLDVKVGSGAFMKNDRDAAELARRMLSAAKADGKDCTAFLTDMDRPLGMYIGNALEVREAIDVLSGSTDTVLGSFCLAMAAELLHMAGKGSREICLNAAKQAVRSGAAMERLQRMIAAQGGDPDITLHPEKLPLSSCSRTVLADKSGWISHMESETIGRACVALGAGRMTKEQSIDPGAGIILRAAAGDPAEAGMPLMTLYAASENQLDAAEAMLASAITITDDKPQVRPMIRRQLSVRDILISG